MVQAMGAIEQSEAEEALGEELTPLEIKFVRELVADPGNQTRVYMKVFGTKLYTTAAPAAVRLMKRPRVAAEIEAAHNAHARRCRAKFTATVRKLASIAFQDQDAYYESDPDNGGLPKPRPWDDIDPVSRKNICGIKIKRKRLKSATSEIYEVEDIEYKVLDPMKALDMLCSYLGITKGGMTPDELRAIIFGSAAAAHQLTAPKAANVLLPGAAQAGDTAPAESAPVAAKPSELHPDE